MALPFEIAGGSVMGRDHVHAGKNNHDAYAWKKRDNVLAAVVCDGCGSGKHSEVGSKLGAQLFATTLVGEYTTPYDAQQLEEVCRRIEGKIEVLLPEPGGFGRSELVNEYFLFTVIFVLITEEHTVIGSIGDGFFSVNGEHTQLGPFPGNAPPYFGYRFVETSISPESLKFKWQMVRTPEVKSVLIGTDGVSDLRDVAESNLPGKQELVGPLSQFWEEDKYFKNPDMVRRRLAMANRDTSRIDWDARTVHKETGLLPDDTTLIAIRRKK